MRVMCVHGLGDHRTAPWREEWRAAIHEAWRVDENDEIDFVSYDRIYEEVELSGAEMAEALAKVGWSGITSLFTRRRGIVSGASHWLRWAAGYAVAWVSDEEFKRDSRAWFLDLVEQRKPDVVLAHSLGSLVTYNALSHRDARRLSAQIANIDYVTLGSQIANPFVRRNLTPGRIEGLAVRRWTHLFNHKDSVFTAPIQLFGVPNFVQIDTPFDLPGDVMNHDAAAYLRHGSTVSGFWRSLEADRAAGGPAGPAARAFGVPKAAPRAPRRRAILVGINEYPDAAQRLEGCVNDVFLMSEILQERGFRPEEIRTCLDGRATAQAIRERLDWLLDDPAPDDWLFFYYSGHGASLPAYGPTDEPDRMEEMLVPVDFDWSAERSIRDDDLFELYSQLPYETRLAMVFDCCHSGGIHRDGAPRARGLTPPDDIRHRSLYWDPKEGMWLPRKMEKLNEDYTDDDGIARDMFGSEGVTVRLGRGSRAQTLTKAEYDRLKAEREGPVGPYLPLIVQACAEGEFAYEYRHGVTSYGAFTFSLARNLRKRSRKPKSFEDVVKAAHRQLTTKLEYEQNPQIVGPKAVREAAVPWLTNG